MFIIFPLAGSQGGVIDVETTVATATNTCYKYRGFKGFVYPVKFTTEVKCFSNALDSADYWLSSVRSASTTVANVCLIGGYINTTIQVAVICVGF